MPWFETPHLPNQHHRKPTTVKWPWRKWQRSWQRISSSPFMRPSWWILVSEWTHTDWSHSTFHLPFISQFSIYLTTRHYISWHKLMLVMDACDRWFWRTPHHIINTPSQSPLLTLVTHPLNSHACHGWSWRYPSHPCSWCHMSHLRCDRQHIGYGHTGSSTHPVNTQMHPINTLTRPINTLRQWHINTPYQYILLTHSNTPSFSPYQCTHEHTQSIRFLEHVLSTCSINAH